MATKIQPHGVDAHWAGVLLMVGARTTIRWLEDGKLKPDETVTTHAHRVYDLDSVLAAAPDPLPVNMDALPDNLRRAIEARRPTGRTEG